VPEWPKRVTIGRVTVRIYKRKTPAGKDGYMIANYSSGKRRMDSYTDEEEAIDAATTLARNLSEQHTIAASLTNDQALEYVGARKRLEPFGVTVDQASSAIEAVLKQLGSIPKLHESVAFYLSRHRPLERVRVEDAVADFMKAKKAEGISDAYEETLKCYLNRFAAECNVDVCDLAPGDVQSWLEGLGTGPGAFNTARGCLSSFFTYCVDHQYSCDNLAEAVKTKRKNGEGPIEIYTVKEVSRLLNAAAPAFLPCLAIQAFAGLRTAEVQRLKWSDVDLAGGWITVTAQNAKTARRRLVPVADNLKAWLTRCAKKRGYIWSGDDNDYAQAQAATASATEVVKGREVIEDAVPWKKNAMRHSFISYKLAVTKNANEVAMEAGNSPAMIFRHYRELVKPEQGAAWFSIEPQSQANVITLPSMSVAS
jgi:site-specific recombinase XerD